MTRIKSRQDLTRASRNQKGHNVHREDEAPAEPHGDTGSGYSRSGGSLALPDEKNFLCVLFKIFQVRDYKIIAKQSLAECVPNEDVGNKRKTDADS
ncbi:MAG: hypothetical protein BECKG1743D_GA0114223_1003213 [Candidatus Kentron sp. G]|nr:MAG: hypothetical protein BECKG1743F_GA0114225_1003514 [Candidatus Kentron sp. G]VFM95993.1 MAG: hypothetical protein BECKG1743E_GA0114224_1002913 [Candidatus Kentron sp. G]VFM97829.1 MAG: hypothetical protein BECKG1743D_GA0114223_1003213 [Candidatus Kentron sp. G]